MVMERVFIVVIHSDSNLLLQISHPTSTSFPNILEEALIESQVFILKLRVASNFTLAKGIIYDNSMDGVRICDL